MNNFFRITQDNVDNFFIGYDKNIKNNLTHQHNNKSNKILKIHNDTNKQINPQLKPSQINFNYEKKNIIDNIVKNNFNCEIIKTKTENQPESINLIQKNLNNKINTNYQNDNIKSREKINNEEKKIIFEYGKSGIKLDRLKKSMKQNYNILYAVNNMVLDYLNFNPKINLNELLKKLTNKVNSNIANIPNEIPNKKIHWNKDGEIIIESNKFFNIILQDEKKIKKYNLIDFGYVKIYGITFTDEYINKQKIPSLNSIITFSDNIKHFLKIIKLFAHTDKFKIKINQFGNNNIQNIITENIPSIILNLNEKKNLFNSNDNKYTFYIKIYHTNTTAFVIDKEEKIIYYFNSIEKNSSGYIFFYVMALDSKYKIINFNKNNEKNNKKNNIQSNKIKNNNIKSNKNKQINTKLKSSSISDFTDKDNFV